MPTPYDTTDGGKSFSREELRIAEAHGVDLKEPALVKCDFCNQPVVEAELDGSGKCADCVGELRAEKSASFIAAPTLGGCLSLMGLRLVASTIAEIRREYGDTTTER